jgi:hypothetical protein
MQQSVYMQGTPADEPAFPHTDDLVQLGVAQMSGSRFIETIENALGAPPPMTWIRTAIQADPQNLYYVNLRLTYFGTDPSGSAWVANVQANAPVNYDP